LPGLEFVFMLVESCLGHLVVSGLGVLGLSCAKVEATAKQLKPKKTAFNLVDFIVRFFK
jgi:hypothetical protein